MLVKTNRIMLIIFILLIFPFVVNSETTKTLLLDGETGIIVAGEGDNSFEVTNPLLFVTVRVEGLPEDQVLALVRENYAADGWLPVTYKGKQLYFTRGRYSISPAEPGTYAISGTTTATVTVYTEE